MRMYKDKTTTSKSHLMHCVFRLILCGETFQSSLLLDPP
jgi:hypothetical protein